MGPKQTCPGGWTGSQALQAPCQCAGPRVIQERGPQTSSSSSTSKPVRMQHPRPHLRSVHLNLHFNEIPGDQMHIEVLGEWSRRSPGSAIWSADSGCDCASIHPNNSQHWFSTFVLTIRFRCPQFILRTMLRSKPGRCCENRHTEGGGVVRRHTGSKWGCPLGSP